MSVGLSSEIAARIRCVVLDVDGVLTDGRLHLGPDGETMKVFHTRDGHGVKMLIDAGLQVTIISGRSSNIVDARAAELGITPVIQGCADKGSALDRLLADLGLSADEVAVMGDDTPDLPMFDRAAISAAPADAHPTVLARCDLRTDAGGGAGAVREFCERLLAARGG